MGLFVFLLFVFCSKHSILIWCLLTNSSGIHHQILHACLTNRHYWNFIDIVKKQKQKFNINPAVMAAIFFKRVANIIRVNVQVCSLSILWNMILLVPRLKGNKPMKIKHDEKLHSQFWPFFLKNILHMSSSLRPICLTYFAGIFDMRVFGYSYDFA